MRSRVAEILRRDRRDEEAALTLGQRLRLALRLGEADVRRYASANGVSLDEARRRLRAAGRIGRRPSCANDLD